jgi:hypothetical protein
MNILGQMVVDLTISEKPLFFTLNDQFFKL